MFDQRTNPLALASLVAGVLAWIVAPIIGSLVAVVTGHIALKQLRTYGGEDGQGLAYVGLALGYVNIIGFALILVMGLVFIGFFAGLAALI